jgi:hypothetical protein
LSLAGELIYVRWPHAEGEVGMPRPALVLEGPDAEGELVLMKGTGQSHYPSATRIGPEELDLLQSGWNCRAACRAFFQRCLNPAELELLGSGLQAHIRPVAEGFIP